MINGAVIIVFIITDKYEVTYYFMNIVEKIKTLKIKFKGVRREFKRILGGKSLPQNTPCV